MIHNERLGDLSEEVASLNVTILCLLKCRTMGRRNSLLKIMNE